MPQDPNKAQVDPNPGSLPEGEPGQAEETEGTPSATAGKGAGEPQEVESLKAKLAKTEKDYKELQGEFTRRSQKMREQERILAQVNANPVLQSGHSGNPNFFDDPVGNTGRISESTAEKVYNRRKFADAANAKEQEDVEGFAEMMPYLTHVLQTDQSLQGADFNSVWKAGEKVKNDYEDKLVSKLAKKLGMTEETAKARMQEEAEGRRLAAGSGGGGSVPPKPKPKMTDEEATIEKMQQRRRSQW
jgi:hypothetical protein